MDLLPLLRARFVRNSAANFLLNSVKKLVSLIIVILIARYLGPTALGKYSFTLYLGNILAVVFALGIPYLLMRELPRLKGKEQGAFLHTSALIVSLSSFILLLSLPLSSFLLGFRLNLSVALALGATMVLSTFIWSVYVGREEQRKAIVPGILSETVRLGMGLLAVLVLSHYLVALLGYVLGLLLFFLLSFPFLYPLLSPNLLDPRKILSRSVFYLFYGVVGLSLIYIDTIMLYLLAGAHETGMYRVPSSIVGSVLQVFPFTVASLPALSRRVAQGEEPRRAFQLYLLPILGASFVFQAATILLGKPFIGIFFGEEYLVTYPLLILLSFLIPLKSLYYYSVQAVVVTEGERIQFLFPLVGTAVNVLLNYLLIPSFGGYGAALASISSFLLATILALWWFKKYAPKVNGDA